MTGTHRIATCDCDILIVADGQKATDMVSKRRTTDAHSSPSPGQILSRSRPPSVGENPAIDVSSDPFRPIGLAQSLKERGVMLAPVLVVWHYKVMAAKPFARWLRTKDILLSGARLSLQPETAETHYLGTYILQGTPPTATSDNLAASDRALVAVQTLWGFSSKLAMTHLFDLCRDRIERVSIVENDICDFVSGLRQYINQAGKSHFSQSVLLASVVV